MATLKLRLLPHAENLPLPDENKRGLDLAAAIPAGAPVIIDSGGRGVIPTGLVVALPPGTEAQIRPRAGLAVRYGVTVLNEPFDASYGGEIQVILINLGSATFRVERGALIARLVVAPVVDVETEWPPVAWPGWTVPRHE